MKTKFLKIAIPLLAATIFSACIKNKDEELGNAGTDKVKIVEAPRKSLFYSEFSDVKLIHLFSLRRDDASPASASQALSFKVTVSEDSLDAYNDEHGTTYEPLPDSLYSFVSAGATKSGDVYTFNLGSNVAGAEFSIALNGAKWDIAHKYGMYFIITDPAGKTIASGTKEVFTTVEVKNIYDGVYSVEKGNVQRYNSPGVPTVGDVLNGDLAGKPTGGVSLATVSPTTVELSGFTWANGNGVAGIDHLQATVDPVTNQVTMKALGNATLKNMPGKENSYDPDSKTFTLNFHWNPAANAREMTLVLKYSKARE